MVINRQKRIPVKIGALDEFCRRATAALRVPRDAATICLVSDAKIASWNCAYRGKAKPTDVLSFPAASLPSKNRNGKLPRLPNSGRIRRAGYLGDIAIAPAVARRNARAFGRSLQDEMRILALHGLLHLMGYDHDADNGAMNRIESRLRRKLGLA
ncbi:MAG TPA: rRNA maturation RNase YbeY [Candidatus Acidoferrales bacterium]|nr:rRNA maturation RNase YbeY [Candidatus Acidoferrales bacterium]